MKKKKFVHCKERELLFINFISGNIWKIWRDPQYVGDRNQI